ncbi:MAG TPA: pseudouridine synthase [Roseiarcus sp.]|nr:pseudouridine synthase [Roseiarcus sp.]
MTIQADNAEPREGQRIAKAMARAGLCSRRDAEQWIAQGRVSVNGEVLASPAFNVSDKDDVRVDGAPLKSAERTRLFLFHKPRGLVTTAKDPEGRSTIFDALPRELPRVVTIGRLDINTEGLLLLTNDGGLARVLELPATGWLRRYRVRAHGEITQQALDGLRGGLTLDGVDYRGIEARFERQQGSNVWLTMGLREGKNREIKRVLEHLGLSVNRLIRVSFGPFELGELAEGAVGEMPTRVLRDQLGPRLAKLAGADFEAAIEARPAERVEPTGPDRPPERQRAEPREGPPRKRKHVSVLRAEARAEAEGPRKRIARATTADRRGRQVQVERVSLAHPPAPAPVRAPRPRKDFEARPPREGAERRPRQDFAGPRPRRDDRPPRRDGEGAARPPREGAERRPREDFAGPRPPRSDHRPPRRDGEGGARPPREGAERKPRQDFAGPRPPRSDHRPPRRDGEGAARPPREGAERRPRQDFAGPRPPRREDRPARRDSEGAARPPREGAARKPRQDFAGPRPPRREDRPARRDGEGAARPPREGAERRPRQDFAGPRPPRREDRPARRDGEGAARPPREGAARKPRQDFAGPRPRRDDRPRGPGKGPPRGGKPGPGAR